MTRIEGTMARSFQPDMFADLTDAVPRWDRLAGVMEFNADLSPDVVQAIWERMTSRDDADQANRAALRAAVSGSATNLAALTAAYVLGDVLPAATYPT